MSRESAMAVAVSATVPTTPTETPSPALKAVPQAPEIKQASDTSAAPEMQSKAFSHLAKKEADIVRQRKELAAERQKIESELKPAHEKYQKFQEMRKTDPIAAMKDLGFTDADIFNYMAAQQPVELTPEQRAAKAGEDAAAARIKTFEDAQAKAEADRQAQADKSIIQSFRSNVSKSMQANPDKFKFCNIYGPAAEEQVYETVKAIIQSSRGEDVPTAAEAVALVEEYYKDSYEETQRKLQEFEMKNKKPPAAPEKTEPVRTRTLSNQVNPPMKAERTLSNATTATVSSTKVYNESRAEKRERLMERLRNGGY